MKRIYFMACAALLVPGVYVLAADGPAGCPEPPIEKIWQEVDTNGDGAISKSEADLSHERRFAKVDFNGDGVIAREEADRAHAELKP